MKEVSLKDGRVIKTPWLRIDEAAAYCGISRTTFDQKAFAVPHGGSDRTRLYHCKVLDRWMEGGIEDVPFVREKISPRRRRVRVSLSDQGEDVVVDPGTGKVYRVPKD